MSPFPCAPGLVSVSVFKRGSHLRPSGFAGEMLAMAHRFAKAGFLAQSQRMDAELTRLGKVHDFIVYEGQQHAIGGRGAERDAATVTWFTRFDSPKKGE